MSDDETPTPRLTIQWVDRRDAARRLVEELRAVELAASQVLASTRARHRAERARHIRNVAADYAAAFERWNREPVPYDEKLEDIREFDKLVELARTLLAGTTGEAGTSTPCPP